MVNDGDLFPSRVLGFKVQLRLVNALANSYTYICVDANIQTRYIQTIKNNSTLPTY